MTYEKALEEMIMKVPKREAVYYAMQALRKQIPSEPYFDHFGNVSGCRICGCVVQTGWKYCAKCGQKLLWEEKENDQ